MDDRPSVLYHGSPVPTDRLELRAARGVGADLDRLTGVYATDLRAYAIAFALAPPAESGTYAWELHLGEDGTPRITYHAGSPNIGGVGYLYLLPADSFVPIGDHQWVSHQPVAPFGREVIRVDDYLHWVEHAGGEEERV